MKIGITCYPTYGGSGAIIPPEDTVIIRISERGQIANDPGSGRL